MHFIRLFLLQMSGKKPPTSSHTCATCNKVFSKKSYGICMKINKKIASSATGLFGQNQIENGTRMLCIGKLRDMCVRIVARASHPNTS